jgi:hypothetical protein
MLEKRTVGSGQPTEAAPEPRSSPSLPSSPNMWISDWFRAPDIKSLAGAPRSSPAQNLELGTNRVPRLVVITSDDRFYYMLLSASIDLHWKITWARSIRRAFECCCSQATPLVILDERLPGVDWREALPCTSEFPDHPAVLLAISEVGEETWEFVLRSGGYDVVPRSARSEEWQRELQFAWLSKNRAGYSTGLGVGSGSKPVIGLNPPGQRAMSL